MGHKTHPYGIQAGHNQRLEGSLVRGQPFRLSQFRIGRPAAEGQHSQRVPGFFRRGNFQGGDRQGGARQRH